MVTQVLRRAGSGHGAHCCRRWGRGGCTFPNPRGGMHASRLWGWHLGREEAGVPRAGSVGWDVPVPVPMPVPGRAGRERKGLRGLCRGPGTRRASQRAAAWVASRGRHWEQLWHLALAEVSGEVQAAGTSWGRAWHLGP